MTPTRACIVCDKDCAHGDLHNACAAVVECMIATPRAGDDAFIHAATRAGRRRWLDGSGGEPMIADGVPNPAFVPGHTMYVGLDVVARVRAEMPRVGAP